MTVLLEIADRGLEGRAAKREWKKGGQNKKMKAETKYGVQNKILTSLINKVEFAWEVDGRTQIHDDHTHSLDSIWSMWAEK